MITVQERRALAQALSAAQDDASGEAAARYYRGRPQATDIVAVTGPPGAGKSTLLNLLASHAADRGAKVAVLAIDPSSPFSGGAVLGDRVRAAAAASHDNVFLRSVAARESSDRMMLRAADSCAVFNHFGFTRIFVETVGAGQMNIEALGIADCIVALNVAGFGDAIQLGKAGFLETADIHVVSKSDVDGADSLRIGLEAMLDIAYPHGPLDPRRRATPGMRELLARHGDAAAEGESWRPPVIGVAASPPRNIERLADEIDGYLAWCTRSGRSVRMRRRRAASLLGVRLKEAILAGITEAEGGMLGMLADQIVAGTLDPAAAVRRALDHEEGSKRDATLA